MVAIWVFLTSWITPTSLFVFLNLMIGTIALTSRFTSGHHDKNHPQQTPAPLVRAPSLLERVRSLDFSSFKFPHPASETEMVAEHGYTTRVDPPQQLERAPSLLERVRSINFSYYNFSAPSSETEMVAEHGYRTPVDPPQQMERTPSLLERMRSINFSYYNYGAPASETEMKAKQGHSYTTQVDPPHHLERAPSLLERVKSINLTSFIPRSNPEPETGDDSESDTSSEEMSENHVNPGNSEHHVTRSKSETRPGSERQASGEKMKKSASEKGVVVETAEGREWEEVEKRRPATTRLEKRVSFGDEAVDEKADDFINRFKQQLKLQRLDSLLRYRRQQHQ